MNKQANEWVLRIEEFAGALLDSRVADPAGVGRADGPSPKRFAVYRNNVVVSLMEALEETFPSIKALMGDENFNRIARAFVARHPPDSPMMQFYGTAFPAFLEALPPLRNSPFLGDLARLERAWIDAFHAGDCAPLSPETLTGFNPEETLGLVFEHHPACRLIVSEFPILDLFDARYSWPAEGVDLEEAQTVLVTRPELSVTITRLNPGQSVFFGHVIDGNTLQEAIGAAMHSDPEFNPASAIALGLETGAFSAVSLNNDQTDSRKEKAA